MLLLRKKNVFYRMIYFQFRFGKQFKRFYLFFGWQNKNEIFGKEQPLNLKA